MSFVLTRPVSLGLTFGRFVGRADLFPRAFSRVDPQVRRHRACPPLRFCLCSHSSLVLPSKTTNKFDCLPIELFGRAIPSTEHLTCFSTHNGLVATPLRTFAPKDVSMIDHRPCHNIFYYTAPLLHYCNNSSTHKSLSLLHVCNSNP